MMQTTHDPLQDSHVFLLYNQRHAQHDPWYQATPGQAATPDTDPRTRPTTL